MTLQLLWLWLNSLTRKVTAASSRDILLRSIQSNFFGLEWKNRLKWAKNHCYTIHTLSSAVGGTFVYVVKFDD